MSLVSKQGKQQQAGGRISAEEDLRGAERKPVLHQWPNGAKRARRLAERQPVAGWRVVSRAPKLPFVRTPYILVRRLP